MIDFHTHILPKVDDGSDSIEESIRLLRMEQKMGVDTVILTPHFYASQNDPEKFLERRARSAEVLRMAAERFEGLPRFLLGAEVQYFEGISYVDSIADLCIEGTDVLLLEMPFQHWDSRTVKTVLDMNQSGRYRLVLAHVERYLADQNAKDVQMLLDSGVQMQVNASFFDGWFKSRRALSMLKKDKIHLIGTDCHNTSVRKPNWNLVPLEAVQMADKNARRLLGSALKNV